MLLINHNYFNITSNKNNKDVGQPYSRRRYFFGLFILLLVDVLWIVSAELTKYIYTELKLERPFLLTYLRSSMLLVYLVVLCFTPPTNDPCRPADYTQLMEQAAETDDENFYNESTTSLGDSTFVPVRAGETTDSDDASPRAVRFNKVAEVRVMSAAQAGEALLARLSWAASVRASEHAQRRAAAAATRRHLRLAAALVAPWFISNYLYRVSILFGGASEATLLAASVCALRLASRVDARAAAAAAFAALAAVILAMFGKQANWTAVLSGVGAAFFYAIHLLIYRNELKKSEGVNAPLLAGLVGCSCACLFWTGGAVLSWAGVEGAALPPPSRAMAALLDAAIGPLLFEVLWLWGCKLTSPQTATASLCLIIPLPVFIDTIRGQTDYAAIGASLLLIAAWMMASWEHSGSHVSLAWIRNRLPSRGFSTLRNIPELDEQSEALMSTEEPT